MCWLDVAGLHGSTLVTLGEHKSFRLNVLDDSAHVFHFDNGKMYRIRRVDIEDAYDDMILLGSISLKEIQKWYSPFTASYVAAILAMLPNIRVHIRPIVLESI